VGPLHPPNARPAQGERHQPRRHRQAPDGDGRHASDGKQGLSKAFNLAEVWGWRPEGSNPCRHVDRYQEDGRERYLADSELRRLDQVLDRAEREWESDPRALVAIRLLIFTGCRSAEILGLPWQDVDIERRCLHLPDSKTGKRTILLNSAAVAILEGLERPKGDVFVIPGDKPGTHRTDSSRSRNRRSSDT